MANRQVPAVYRQVINNVIQAVRIDFEEMGIEDSVLVQLQEQWEQRLAQSRAADFSADERMAAHMRALPQASTSANASADNADSKDRLKTSASSSSNKPAAKVKPPPADENVIGSDLDDSEEELLGDPVDDPTEDGDLVVALYDKVTRVKNKWKVSLKDGIISAKGKDYLFSKCAGEFEW